MAGAFFAAGPGLGALVLSTGAATLYNANGSPRYIEHNRTTAASNGLKPPPPEMPLVEEVGLAVWPCAVDPHQRNAPPSTATVAARLSQRGPKR